MSSPDHLKAELQNTPLPTLAELRARVLADETLPLARQRDMASALASLAKALANRPRPSPPTPRRFASGSPA